MSDWTHLPYLQLHCQLSSKELISDAIVSKMEVDVTAILQLASQRIVNLRTHFAIRIIHSSHEPHSIVLCLLFDHLMFVLVLEVCNFQKGVQSSLYSSLCFNEMQVINIISR